jgi:Raf kinase inhibitor-like YbhB/YbcL family protein
LVTGIDPATTSIEEGFVPPDARVWPNAFGDIAYDGPAPPVGDPPHRYFFRLYALDAELDEAPDRDLHEVIEDVEDHSLAAGTLVGIYQR